MTRHLVKRLVDWVAIRLSDNVRIDGLWVGVFADNNHAEILNKLREALLLIKTYDPYRYKRVLKEMDRLWVNLLPGDQAAWFHADRRCVIDPRHVRSASTELTAAAIVHEATHGTLMRRGVGYPEDLRDRVEQVCRRQELAFASKIPNGEELRQQLSLSSGYPPDFWTDTAFAERQKAGEVEMATYAKVPSWLLQFMLRRRERLRRRQRGT